MSDGSHSESEPTERNERTADDHPGNRLTDHGWLVVLWRHKLYRDVFLVIFAFVIWQGFAAIQESRESATQKSCDAFNDAVASVNALSRVTQGLILAGAALPGDTPGPQNVDPEEWKTLAPGPLSRQLEKQYPDFPSSQERLDRAKANAKRLEATHVVERDCAKELNEVKGAS